MQHRAELTTAQVRDAIREYVERHVPDATVTPNGIAITLTSSQSAAPELSGALVRYEMKGAGK